MIPGPWIPGFQDSGSALELANFDWYQHLGYESQSVYDEKLDFQHRISKFQAISRKLLEVFRNYEILKFCVENQVSWPTRLKGFSPRSREGL